MPEFYDINSNLSGKSNTGHTHDDRYYTESEINTKLSGIHTGYTYEYASELGKISNALLIDTTNPLGNNNKAYYVATSTTNKPSNCSWAVREVMYIHSKAIVLRLTGSDNNGTPHQWFTYYDGSWKNWTQI